MKIYSRGANAPDAELVWTQILQGLGGGFAVVLQVTAIGGANWERMWYVHSQVSPGTLIRWKRTAGIRRNLVEHDASQPREVSAVVN